MHGPESREVGPVTHFPSSMRLGSHLEVLVNVLLLRHMTCHAQAQLTTDRTRTAPLQWDLGNHTDVSGVVIVVLMSNVTCHM